MERSSSGQDEEEIGFLLLPSFHAAIHRQKENHHLEKDTNCKQKWQNVKLVGASCRKMNADVPSGYDYYSCTKCHVQLHLNQNQNQNQDHNELECERFSGTTSDIVCNDCSIAATAAAATTTTTTTNKKDNHDTCTTKIQNSVDIDRSSSIVRGSGQKQRSDASLLLGAIHACEQDGSLQSNIHIRMLPKHPHHHDNEDEDGVNANTKCNATTASLVRSCHVQAAITISIPSDCIEDDEDVLLRSTCSRSSSTTKKKRPRSNDDPTNHNNNPAFQMVMTLMQSDWSKFEQFWSNADFLCDDFVLDGDGDGSSIHSSVSSSATAARVPSAAV